MHKFILITFSISFILLGSFAEEAKDQKTIKSELKETGQELKELANVTVDKMGSEKDALVRKFNEKLAVLDAEIKEIKVHVSAYMADAKKNMNARMEALEEKKGVFKEKLSEFSEKSEDAYEDLKDGLEHAWNEVESVYAQVKQEYKKS